MELACLIGLFVVMGVSIAGNVFQARIYWLLVKRYTNPPGGFLEEAIVDAANAGNMPAAQRIRAEADALVDDGELRTDHAI